MYAIVNTECTTVDSARAEKLELKRNFCFQQNTVILHMRAKMQLTLVTDRMGGKLLWEPTVKVGMPSYQVHDTKISMSYHDHKKFYSV